MSAFPGQRKVLSFFLELFFHGFLLGKGLRDDDRVPFAFDMLVVSCVVRYRSTVRLVNFQEKLRSDSEVPLLSQRPRTRPDTIPGLLMARTDYRTLSGRDTRRGRVFVQAWLRRTDSWSNSRLERRIAVEQRTAENEPQSKNPPRARLIQSSR